MAHRRLTIQPGNGAAVHVRGDGSDSCDRWRQRHPRPADLYLRHGRSRSCSRSGARRDGMAETASASEQLDAARKLDPDAILEGKNKKGILYRFSINELEAEALLIEGITLHAYDNRRAVRALRKATTVNANSSYAFYVLGLMHAANM